MSDLKSRLIRSSEVWAAAHECALSRIAKRVAGDANFFVRLESPEATCNIATLEKFARFLGDPTNWPDGAVPEAVREFVHVVGVIPEPASPSPDTCPADIAGHEPPADAHPCKGLSEVAPAAAVSPPAAAAGAFVCPEAAE